MSRDIMVKLILVFTCLISMRAFSDAPIALTRLLEKLAFTSEQIKSIAGRENSASPSWIENGETNFNWLREIGLADPRGVMTDQPQLLGASPEILKSHYKSLREMGFDELNKTIQYYPALIQLDPERNIRPKLLWLSSLGIEDPLNLAQRFPSILGANFGRLVANAERLRQFGFSNLGETITSNPYLIISTEDYLNNAVIWLRDVGVSDPASLIISHPAIVRSGLRESLEEKAAWIKKNGGKNPAKTFNHFPSILDVKIADNLEPKRDWLYSIGVKSIAKILDLHPSVLTASLDGQLKPVYNWMLSIGIKDPAKLIEFQASILNLDLENLEGKRQWLLASGIKPQKVYDGVPTFFTLNIKRNLEPKIEWFESIGVQNIGSLFSNAPQLLALSLEENIKPTWAHLHNVWGMKVSQLNSSAKYLFAKLPRVVALAEYLTSLGVDLHSLSWRTRRTLISGYREEEFRFVVSQDERANDIAPARLHFIQSILHESAQEPCEGSLE